MKYAVDKIEDNVVTLENISDCSITNIDKNIISYEVKEGDILLFDGKNYIKDDLSKEERIKRIREKMMKLKGE